MHENEGTTLKERRFNALEGMTASDFSERLQKKAQLATKLVDVISEAVQNGEIESWEYPEIENSVGILFATVYGVPATADLSIDQLLTSRITSRVPAGAGVS